MYCPSCGSNNQDEVKFCTRCGTNLDVVSDALRGRTTGPLEKDERLVDLLKDYYRSRRMTIIGTVASLIALFKLALILLIGFPEKLVPLVALLTGLLLYGLFALIWGISKWNNSSSELKALGISPARRKALASAREQRQIPANQASIVNSGYATDPINNPASVTEQTTHLLEESEPKTSPGISSQPNS